MGHNKFRTVDFKALSMAQNEVFEKLVRQEFINAKDSNNVYKDIKPRLMEKLKSHGIFLTNSSYNMHVTKFISQYKKEQISTITESDTITVTKPIEIKNESKLQDTHKQYEIGDTANHHANRDVYSASELVIANVLKELLVPFLHESTLEGLVSHNDNTVELPCDFILDINGQLAMIEYNGQQHYQDMNNNLTSYSRLITNDNRRLMFAIKTGIPFLVISYKDHDTEVLKRIVTEFISDIKSNTITSQKYSEFTYGYFGAYSSDNNKLYKKVFPHPQYPVLNMNSKLGYIELTSDKILIWDKDRLERLIEDNENLSGKCNAFYQLNKDLKAQLEVMTKVLQQANTKLKEYKLSSLK